MGRNKLETDFQRDIIKYTKNQGGEGSKWSSSYKVGVPDLILSMPDPDKDHTVRRHEPMGTILAEVKVERGIDHYGASKSFTRKLDVTDLQHKWLKRYWKAGTFTCLLVVLDGGDSRKRAICALPPWSTRIYWVEGEPSPFPIRKLPHGGEPDMFELFQSLKKSGGITQVPEEWAPNY